jgi:hypothetical protein
MDKSLKKVLELAQTRGAVVLLDEANVLGAKRDDHDLIRNAVASSLLRQLKYYQRIPIVTSRVESIFLPFKDPSPAPQA